MSTYVRCLFYITSRDIVHCIELCTHTLLYENKFYISRKILVWSFRLWFSCTWSLVYMFRITKNNCACFTMTEVQHGIMSYVILLKDMYAFQVELHPKIYLGAQTLYTAMFNDVVSHGAPEDLQVFHTT